MLAVPLDGSVTSSTAVAEANDAPDALGPEGAAQGAYMGIVSQGGAFEVGTASYGFGGLEGAIPGYQDAVVITHACFTGAYVVPGHQPPDRRYSGSPHLHPYPAEAEGWVMYKG